MPDAATMIFILSVSSENSISVTKSNFSEISAYDHFDARKCIVSEKN